MVVLQCVLTYVFMERHWQLVTKRLSTALTQDIAAIIELHETYPGQTNEAILDRIAQHRLKIDVEFLPQGELRRRCQNFSSRSSMPHFPTRSGGRSANLFGSIPWDARLSSRSG
jgi:hypothetical protein